MMKFNVPPLDVPLASKYEQTLLGSLLGMNPCPKEPEGPYEFFYDDLERNSHVIHTSNVLIWEVCVLSVLQ